MPTARRTTWRRRLVRGGFAGGLLVGLVVGVLWLDGRSEFGGRPTGERMQRMKQSPQWSGGKFANPQPLHNEMWAAAGGLLRRSKVGSPTDPIPVVRGDGSLFDTPPPSGFRVTWFGHSSTLLELDGARVLTDPVWGDRSSPFRWAGPKRWYDPPVPLDGLPAIDAVLISHDHYDHLQRGTLESMRGWDTTFVVPLGVGANLEAWGVPSERIVELDWWERVEVGGLEIVATPARHASGRQVFDSNRTLWAGYALLGKEHRVYYSGDTGLFPGLREIGERYGPFDLTMIEVGAYDKAWPDWHIGPEQAVLAHQWVRGEVLLPVHWGLWNLSLHGWTEPAERVAAAAAEANEIVVIPRPGQSVEPGAPPPLERWWPDLPWDNAEAHPIVSTLAD